MSLKANTKSTVEEKINERNFLSSETQIKGDIISNGVIRIDGSVEGNIISKGRVVLGTKANIKGNINSEFLEIEGETNGDCNVSDTLTIRASARITGKIKTKKLHIEPGALFNGTCEMRTSEQGFNTPAHPVESAKHVHQS